MSNITGPGGTAAATIPDFSVPSVPLSQMVEEEIRAGRVELPVLPEVAIQVKEVVGREGDAREVTEIVEREPSLAAAILRYSNSVAFAGLREITDLNQAVMRLGLDAVEKTIVAISAKNAFQGKDQADERLFRTLWYHSITTAIAARRLSSRVPGVGAEVAFLGGLLHDIGKVVILHCAGALRKRHGIADGFPEPVLIEFFDSLHCRIGESFLQSWNVPASIRRVVGHHHDTNLTAPDDMLVIIVSFADRLAAKLGASVAPDPDIALLDHPAAAMLRLDDLKLASLLVDVEDDAQHLRDAL